tara:strand:+ start:548 stop:739 length:192 start_codon:yes stop_codon:yes gene_type:complete
MNFNTVRHQSILKRVVIVERDIGGYIGVITDKRGIFEVSDTYATRQEVQQDINEGYIDYTDFL